MNPDKRSLGRRIAIQRRGLFLTQRQLAEQLGVTQSAVARWECGECAPALRHRRAIADALAISPSILFAEPASEVAA